MKKTKKKLVGIICVILAVLVATGGVIGFLASGIFNKYTFTIDATQKGTTLNNVVNNVNIWSIEGNPFKDAQRSQENDIFEFVEYVQFMQCTGGTETRDLFKDPNNKDVLDDYDFTLLIDNCRGVVNLGAKPMLKLGNVPLKFSKNATTEVGFGMNPYPPDDYEVYYNYIYAMGEALVKEFGAEEVLTWRFGIMTEYENDDWFFAGAEDEPDPEKSAEAYCKLYDYSVAALQDSIGENVFVGAHSMTVTEGLWDEAEFIKHCGEGTNYKTGKKGTRLCYLATSFYDSTPGDYTDGKTLPESVEYLRETAESVGLKDLIYGVDEGRILEGNSSGTVGSELLTRTCGYTYQGAYDARLIAQMFNNDIAYFSAWSYLSNGFFQGNPTVSYHVARNASKWGGNKLLSTEKTKSGVIFGSDVDAVSAFDEDENTLRIMAYNFKNDVEYNKNVEMTFEINAPQFEGKKVKVTAYVINDDCNYFDEWVEDRKTHNITDDCFSWSPDDPSIDNPTTLVDEKAREIYFNELYPKYAECSKLKPVNSEAEIIDGKITLNITLDPHAVVFYEISE